MTRGASGGWDVMHTLWRLSFKYGQWTMEKWTDIKPSGDEEIVHKRLDCCVSLRPLP